MKTVLSLLLILSSFSALAGPIQLHPRNPHYFSWHGQPTLLITSGEHYGAVLNLDFNYVRYINTLARDGLNLTRTFSGAYCEDASAFNIAHNTLAPANGRLMTPWARSTTPGYANGGNKFDLHRWNDAYFKRLKDFIREANRRDVVVEFTLFCPFYKDDMWKLSPMNADNNVNGVGAVNRTNVYTLDQHGGLLAVQEAMTRKVVAELNEFDNVMWEICNEPYFGGVTMDWQHHIADVITRTESGLRQKHLITQNIANGKKLIENPHPAVSVFNFHYASPPETVAMNYALDKVIGDNETGFKGTNDTHYRMEGWEFILAGGALYNNLDYSFTVGHEDGTFVYHAKQPGGGNPTLRSQFHILGEFIRSFDFVKMRPDKSVVKDGVPEKGRVQALVEPGRQYAIYVFGGGGETSIRLALDLPKGSYRMEWVNPLTGRIDKRETIRHRGGPVTLASPRFEQDVALRIRG